MRYRSEFFPYRKEGAVAERPHLNLPKDTFEEEIGLNGFFGAVTHLYHHHAPTTWSGIERASFQWPLHQESSEDFLRPQCYLPEFEKTESTDFFQRLLLFYNADITVSLRRLSKAQTIYFRNADAHEVHFVHSGEMTMESPWGRLDCAKGDYVLIPRGVTYRFIPNASTTVELLSIESFGDSFRKPDTGILGLQALYHEEGIRSPKLEKNLQYEARSTVRIQKEGRLTDCHYDFDLRHVAGWCGTLYPCALSVSAIAPVLSSVAHLPPSVNSTFVTSNFIICTFLPRPLEEPEGALRVPFFHSNIDFDEVIFYHEGNFFSRDHMKKGSITLHPRGIHHGPHPKALKNQNRVTRTDEIAVMIDTVKPLKVTKDARNLEIPDYWKSWNRD